MGRRTCHRQELKSLLGHLHHACKVVRPGRAFLRRVIDLLTRFRNRSHPVRINAEFRRDPQWWLAIFQEWNGISFFLRLGFIPLPDLCAWSRRRTFILPLSHIRCFLQFCHQLARQRMVHNVTWLVSARRLAPSSISVYHSAVRSLHIDHGFADPMLDTPRLHRLIRGYQAFRSSLQAFTLTNHSPIIWRDSTLPIRRFLWPSYVLGSVLSCYLSLVLPPSTLASTYLFLTTPLTPLVSFIFTSILPRPITFARAIWAFIQPWLLCAPTMFFGGTPGTLFLTSSSVPLSPSFINQCLRCIFTVAGLGSSFSSHSFHNGAATSTASVGVLDHLIKTLGRWSSNAYQRYIRTHPRCPPRRPSDHGLTIIIWMLPLEEVLRSSKPSSKLERSHIGEGFLGRARTPLLPKWVGSRFVGQHHVHWMTRPWRLTSLVVSWLPARNAPPGIATL